LFFYGPSNFAKTIALICAMTLVIGCAALLAYYVTVLAVKFKVDPDNVGIPVVTSSMVLMRFGT
jgi:cation transporter-like permease